MDYRLINLIKLFSVVALSLLISGCLGSNMFGANNASTISTTSRSAMKRQTTGVYYDFDDILIPKELTIVDKSTVLVSTPGYVAGIMTLRGRVEKRSLSIFFINNMQKDNWENVSRIRSPASTIMVFKKPSKWAVITIRANDFYTYVEIGVSPTLENTNPSSSAPSEKNIFN